MKYCQGCGKRLRKTVEPFSGHVYPPYCCYQIRALFCDEECWQFYDAQHRLDEPLDTDRGLDLGTDAVVTTFRASRRIARGDLVAIDPLDGSLVKASARDPTLARGVVGMVVERPRRGEAEVVTHGAIDGFALLRPGAHLYLTSRPGAFSIDPPAGSQWWLVRVGLAIDEHRILLRIETAVKVP